MCTLVEMVRIDPKAKLLRNIALIAIFVFLLNGFLFGREPLIDLHGFRQTQTASTAFWMFHGYGFFHLNYPLPVIGAPWSAPFEFPLFQFLVGIIAKIFTLPIDFTGRIFSLVCTLLIIHPTYLISKSLKVELNSYYIFLIFFFSSSQYLYWGRSFLIETFSVLLTLYMLMFYIRNRTQSSKFNFGSFTFFLTLSLVEKVTTAIVPTALICIVEFATLYKSLKIERKIQVKNILNLTIITLSLVVADMWVKFSDKVKDEGLISSSLTSAKLTGWNFGVTGQRFSREFWIRLILEKNLLQNSLAVFGLMAIIWLLLQKKLNSSLVCALLFLWFAPMAIFTNLHLVHIYYQTENLLYLLAAVALGVGYFIQQRTSINLCAVLVSCVLIFNYSVFTHFYLGHERLDPKSNSQLQIARFIKQNTSVRDVIIISGKDWDPTISYYSQRFAVTIPDWFTNRFSLISHNFPVLGGGRKVGSLVIC